jgi:hypothetical protein
VSTPCGERRGAATGGDDVGRYRLGIDIGGTFTDFALGEG